MSEPQGWPQQRFWRPRRLLGLQVRRLIAELDPDQDDAEIVHLSWEVLLPAVAAHVGYAAAGAHTCAAPRVARRILRGGLGDQVVRPYQRDADTLTFFSELIRRGHRSPEGIAAADRIQRIHRAVKGIRNDDQVYTLGLLIFGADRFARAYGRAVHSDVEQRAQFNFWVGTARNMRLVDVPETPEAYLRWMSEYESTEFRPSEEGHEAAEAHVRGVEPALPRPVRGLARPLVVATMNPHVRRCLGYRPMRPAVMTTLRGLWRVAALASSLLPTRLDNTLATAYSRLGQHPDLERLGYGANPG